MQQATPKHKTIAKIKHLLDYAATYKNATLRYYASDMILKLESDAAYLVIPHAKSRIAGFFHLANNDTTNKFVNGPLHINCKTLKHVVSSAAEAKRLHYSSMYKTQPPSSIF